MSHVGISSMRISDDGHLGHVRQERLQVADFINQRRLSRGSAAISWRACWRRSDRHIHGGVHGWV
jgi:hypothetical protein